MIRQKPWRPILEDSLAEQAREAVFAIARDLARQTISTPALANGHAGMALLYGALARFYPEPPYRNLAEEHLEQAINTLASASVQPDLHSGFTGVAFAVEILQEAGEEDLNEVIDEALFEHLEQPEWNGDYDLFHGLVGYGVYALQRLPRPHTRACLASILTHLEGTAQRHPEGALWMRTLSIMSPNAASYFTKGCYNLGIAHGPPGVIAFLGRMCQAGVEEERTRALLKDAVSGLFAHKLPGASSVFPDFLHFDKTPYRPARSAWCYGDPGVSAALMVAARGAGDPLLEKEALVIALKAASRPAEESQVKDAGLCHGAAGLGHIFNRLYQATGEEPLLEAARFWFRRTLDLRSPGQGTGGFLYWQTGDGGINGWQELPGIWVGACGTALALLAAISPIEPTWDRALLLSPL